jgi:molybdopterin-guanine dinucleotide biosynthesis protein B
MHELRGAPEPSLAELVGNLSPCDFVLVEGFKRERVPKLEVHRAENRGAEWIFPHDPGIVGIATDAPVQTSLPVFRLDDVGLIVAFLMEHAQQIPGTRPRLVANSPGR